MDEIISWRFILQRLCTEEGCSVSWRRTWWNCQNWSWSSEGNNRWPLKCRRSVSRPLRRAWDGIKEAKFFYLAMIRPGPAFSMPMHVLHATCSTNSMNESDYGQWKKMWIMLTCSTTFIPGNLVLTYENRGDRNWNDGGTISDQTSKERTQSHSL